jgi:hypothetical protein
VRRNRLNLLHRIRAICSGVADLTKIEGSGPQPQRLSFILVKILPGCGGWPPLRLWPKAPHPPRPRLTPVGPVAALRSARHWPPPVPSRARS